MPASAFAEEGAKAGLPQLDSKFFAGQIFWLVISFGLLYFLLVRFALPAVRRTQDKRKARLDNDLAIAAKANDTAKATLAFYEKTLADAHTKAHALIADTSAKIAQDVTARTDAQKGELARRLADSEKSLAGARQKAMTGIEDMADTLAKDIVQKIMGARGS